jgi:PAS domain S-box-containing protein
LSQSGRVVERRQWHLPLALVVMLLGTALLAVRHFGTDFFQGHGLEALALGLLTLGSGLLAGLWRGERLRAAGETARRESEERFRALVEQTGSGVVIVQDGLVSYANPRAAEIAGRAVTELEGRPLADFIVAEQRERLLTGLRQIAEGREHSGVPYDVMRPDGTRQAALSASTRPAASSTTIAFGSESSTARTSSSDARARASACQRSVTSCTTPISASRPRTVARLPCTAMWRRVPSGRITS